MKKRLFKYLISTFVFGIFAGCGPSPAEREKVATAVDARKASEAEAEASAAATKAAEEEARKKRADRSLLNKLKSKKDEMAGLTFYSAGPIHSFNNYIRLYIVDSGENLNLRLIVQYFGDDWLFVNRAWTRISNMSVDLPLSTWERDNSGGKVWEWSDSRVSGDSLITVKALLETKNPVIRFEGQQYYKDFKPSPEQLQAMRKVLAAYEAATGTAF